MKAFGIAALSFSIIGVVTPLVGAFIAGLSGVLAFFSAGNGLTYGLSAVIINIVNIVFLSPSLVLSASDEHAINAVHQERAKTYFAVLMTIQAIAIVIFIVRWLINKRVAY
jgi:low affinity Fe/Cu permease